MPTAFFATYRQGRPIIGVLGEFDALLILTSDANLIVAKKSANGFEQMAKYSVADSPTYAHPVAMGKRILVKDDVAIALWSME